MAVELRHCDVSGLERGMGVGPAVGNNKRGMWDAGEVPSAFVLRLGISHVVD